MPELLDDFGDPDRSSRARVLSRIAHFYPWLIAGLVGWSIVADILGRWVYGPWWASIISTLLIYTAIGITWAHQDYARMCVTCMEKVSPNAPVQAQRWKRLLWLQHKPGVYWFAGVWLTLLVFSALMHYVILQLPFDVIWMNLPADLLVYPLLMGGWLHHKWRPWCPYCKRWDGGGGPREIAPTPDPSGVKAA